MQIVIASLGLMHINLWHNIDSILLTQCMHVACMYSVGQVTGSTNQWDQGRLPTLCTQAEQ